MDIYFVTSQTDLGKIIKKFIIFKADQAMKYRDFWKNSQLWTGNRRKQEIRFVSLFLSAEAVEAAEHVWEDQARPKGKARGKGRPGRKIRRRFLGQRDRLAETTVGRTLVLP